MSNLISRQAAIDKITKYCMKYDLRDLLAEIEVLPSAQPEVAKDTNVPSNDCISRQAAIDALDKDPMGGLNYNRILNTLPSAQKTGHWIDKTRGDQKNSECSECHTLFRVLIHDYPYCPCCGSRNRGEKE